MGDPFLIAPVRNHLGEPTLRLGEQHDAAIRRDPSAIKGGSDLCAERLERRTAADYRRTLAGVAPSDPGQRVGFSTKSYARSKAYDTSATSNPPRHE
jgi:hypothetical protein